MEGIGELAVGLAVVERQVPDQRAAEDDVEQLVAAADAQQGEPAIERGGDQLALVGVAVRVELRRGRARHGAVAARVDVLASNT